MSLSELKDKHNRYIEICYQIGFGIGILLSFLNWVKELFINAHYGNLIGFLMLFILQSLLLGLWTIIYAAIIGTIIVVITFIPYLVIRGIVR
jgi:hypothetical protein